MTLEYAQAVQVKRRPWQRRIEVFSQKLWRRLTLFSRDAQDAWILLEADPHVHSFCERPAYVEGNAGRVLDFWVDRGRHQQFWVVSPTDMEKFDCEDGQRHRRARSSTRGFNGDGDENCELVANSPVSHLLSSAF
jgi:hypothetical protein